MPLPPLTLRSVKGSPLTNEEMDLNFTTISDGFDALEADQAELRRQRISYYAASAAGVDDYEISITPAPTALADLIGVPIYLKADVANTTDSPGATLKVNSLDATAIKKQGALSPEADDIKAGEIVTLICDGTNFQLIGK